MHFGSIVATTYDLVSFSFVRSMLVTPGHYEHRYSEGVGKDEHCDIFENLHENVEHCLGVASLLAMSLIKYVHHQH